MKLKILLILLNIVTIINSENCYNEKKNNIIKGNILKYTETIYNCEKNCDTTIIKNNLIKKELNTPYTISGNIVYIYKNIYNCNSCN